MSKKTLKNKRKRPTAKRCQFTLPPEDIDLIEELRSRYQTEEKKTNEGYVDVAKSEIIRAGLKALSKMADSKLKKVVNEVEKLKQGRPFQK